MIIPEISLIWMRNGCIERFSMDDITDEVYKMRAIYDMSDNRDCCVVESIYQKCFGCMCGVSEEQQDNMNKIFSYDDTEAYKKITIEIEEETELYLAMYGYLMDHFPKLSGYDSIKMHDNGIPVVRRYIAKELTKECICRILQDELNSCHSSYYYIQPKIAKLVDENFGKLKSLVCESAANERKFEKRIKDMFNIE